MVVFFYNSLSSLVNFKSSIGIQFLFSSLWSLETKHMKKIIFLNLNMDSQEEF